MSGAAAAFEPGPQPGRAFARHEAAWEAYLREHGFLRLPHTFVNHVMPACRGLLQVACAMHIFTHTVGARPTKSTGYTRPEWCKVTMAALAKRFDATINGVDLALQVLVKMGVIESRRAGHVKEYRVRLDKWETVVPVDLPKVVEELASEDDDTDDDQAEVVAVAPTEPLILLPKQDSRPMQLAAPARRFQVLNQSTFPVRIGVSGTGGVLRIELTDQVAEFQEQLEKRKAKVTENNQGARQSHSLENDLRDLLHRYLLTKLQAPCPDRILRPQAERLAEAGLTPSEFEPTLRRASSKFTSWGFLTKVVDDSIATAAAAAKIVRAESRQQTDPREARQALLEEAKRQIANPLLDQRSRSETLDAFPELRKWEPTLDETLAAVRETAATYMALLKRQPDCVPAKKVLADVRKRWPGIYSEVQSQ